MVYTAIPNADVDGDSPLDETLMTALRDNNDYLKARLVTASGHTHDQGGADEGGPVVPAPDSVTNEMMYNHTAGDFLYHSNDAEVTDSSSTGYVIKKEILLTRGGTYRIKFEMKSNGSDSVTARLYRNGLAVGTERTYNGASYSSPYSEDIAGWSAGENLELWLNDSTSPAYAQNLRIYVAVPEQPQNTLGA